MQSGCQTLPPDTQEKVRKDSKGPFCLHLALPSMHPGVSRSFLSPKQKSSKGVTSVSIFCPCLCVYMLSHVHLFVTAWTEACQVPLHVEFSRQEYWSGLPFSTPGDLPNPGIEPASLTYPVLASGFFTTLPLLFGDLQLGASG